MRAVEGEFEFQKVLKRVRQIVGCEFVANPTADWCRRDKATTSQAREVVREVRTCRSNEVGKLCGMGWSVEQRNQHPLPDGVGERNADPC